MARLVAAAVSAARPEVAKAPARPARQAVQVAAARSVPALRLSQRRARAPPAVAEPKPPEARQDGRVGAAAEARLVAVRLLGLAVAAPPVRVRLPCGLAAAGAGATSAGRLGRAVLVRSAVAPAAPNGRHTARLGGVRSGAVAAVELAVPVTSSCVAIPVALSCAPCASKVADEAAGPLDAIPEGVGAQPMAPVAAIAARAALATRPP